MAFIRRVDKAPYDIDHSTWEVEPIDLDETLEPEDLTTLGEWLGEEEDESSVFITLPKPYRKSDFVDNFRQTGLSW
jgi:hypothetical protein